MEEEPGIEGTTFTSKIKKLISNFLGVNEIKNTKILGLILSLFSAIVIYFFYNLGYAFLYGFYFGGKDDQISIFEIMINPVPFNFKSIVGVGFVLLVFVCISFILLYRILKSSNIKVIVREIILYIMCVFIQISSCAYLFIGNLDNTKAIGDIVSFIVVINLVPAGFFCWMWFIKYSHEYFWRVVLSIGYSFLVSSILVLKIGKEYINILTILTITIFPIILFSITSYFKWVFKKYAGIIEAISKFFQATLIAIFFIAIIFAIFDNSSGWITMIIIGIFNALNFSRSKIVKYFKANHKESKVIEEKPTKNEVDNKIVHLKSFIIKKVTIKAIILGGLFMVLIGVLLYVNMLSMCILTGRIVRTSLSNMNYDRIIFDASGEKIDTDGIKGNIVTQSGDIYYISSYPERKLITIKSKNIMSVPSNYVFTKDNNIGNEN